jgi:predicted NAD-dependent protein-ADP-ribosyltransferase YbiA (DUF1768 family)
MNTEIEDIDRLSKHYNWTIRERQRIEDFAKATAEQQAIEFANWRLSICDLYVNFEQFAKSKPKYVDGTKFKTTEQLYQLFLQERTTKDENISEKQQ